MKKIIAFLICALLIVSSVGIFSHLSMVEKLAQATIVREGEIQKDNAYREKLSQWVYERSSKISRPATRQIVDEVMRYDHPVLLLALLQAESAFSPTAYSSSGAIGLGQITWKIWGKPLVEAGILKEARDLYDVSMNIKATDHIFSLLMKSSKGNTIAALESYVGGKHKAYVEKVAHNFLQLSMIKGSA